MCKNDKRRRKRQHQWPTECLTMCVFVVSAVYICILYAVNSCPGDQQKPVRQIKLDGMGLSKVMYWRQTCAAVSTKCWSQPCLHHLTEGRCDVVVPWNQFIHSNRVQFRISLTLTSIESIAWAAWSTCYFITAYWIRIKWACKFGNT